ncbi:sugar-binding domain-containing protein [Arcticibacter sp.]|uniref:sugar-binding domain-containing protein n=1 Tax=Arcticibacter sp. TaxID=1872630 RepID=UPI00388F4CA8
MKFLCLFALSICFSCIASAQVSFGKPEKIISDWKFSLQPSSNAAMPEFDDSKWQSVNIPHDWSVKSQLSPTLASATGYLPGGIGWYRRSLSVPSAMKSQKVYLYFEGVYNRSEVFINGKLVGKRPNGYISFMYDVTPYISFGKENTIAVRVDHSQSADSRWYTGSGIYRDVWVIYANPTHIAQWGVFAYPIVGKQQSSLNVDVEIDNYAGANSSVTITNELFSPEGRSVSKGSKTLKVAANSKGKISHSLQVSNPRLWSIDNPNLYTLRTTVTKDRKVIDQSTTKTGFRSFTFDPDKGFALNNQWMKMKGVCLHHDAGALGSAVPREVWKRRLETLKELGVNAVRTSHNPQAPDLYQLCDELGLLVMNEAFDEWRFPKRKWLEGWNVGTPGYQGTFDFFEEWGERDLADMVKRDRNHISVFAWSIGNEVDYPNDPYSHPILAGTQADGFTQAIYGGFKKDAPDAMELGVIAKRLAAVVKQHDRSRPVTAGLAGVAMSNETAYPGTLDIAGYNYTENRYDSDHKKYPKRVIYGSENRHDYAAWKAVRDNEHIFGQFLWTGIDYLGESGAWPSRGFYSGLLDFGGFIKPRGFFRQSLWSEKPMAYAGTYPVPTNKRRANDEPSMDAWPIWNYQDGQQIRVVCYTNGASAKLLLNGKAIGEQKPYNDEYGIISWDIPYAAGKLEAVALNKNNEEIARYALTTSKQPYALTIKAGEKSITKDQGLAQIYLQVVDEDGIPVVLSDNEVTCQIEGPATLLALEASNNTDMSDYTDNTHRVYHGKILSYIQATGKAGQVKVRFSSPWLKAVETTIEVK